MEKYKVTLAKFGDPTDTFSEIVYADNAILACGKSEKCHPGYIATGSELMED